MIIRTITVPTKEDRLMVGRFLGVKARQAAMAKRRKQIVLMMNGKKQIPIKDIAAKLSVTIRTIYKDINASTVLSAKNGVLYMEARHE